MPQNRGYLLSVHCPNEPLRVLHGTEPLVRQPSQASLLEQGADRGWTYDSQRRIAWIRTAAGWYYTADHRGDKDPEKDTVGWLDTAAHDEGAVSVSLEFER